LVVDVAGGDEIKIVFLARVPGAVFAAVEAYKAGVDRSLLELERAQARYVAQIDQAEIAGGDFARRRVAEAELAFYSRIFGIEGPS